MAAWWQDDVDSAIRARERAYVLRREQDRTVEAARRCGLPGLGLRCYARCQRSGEWVVAAGAPPGRGACRRRPNMAWLPLIEASFYLDTDAAEVLRLSTEAVEHARRHGALDIEMTGADPTGSGAREPRAHRRRRALLLDEGTAAADRGASSMDPIAIGSCCCNMIIACERSRDFDSGGAVVRAAERVRCSAPVSARCWRCAGRTTARSMAARGAWDGAVSMTSAWAAGELARLRPPLAGFARARLAQLRHRQGRDQRGARAAGRCGRLSCLCALVRAEVTLDAGDLRGRAWAMPSDTCAALDGSQQSRPPQAYELLVRIGHRLGRPRHGRARRIAGLERIAAAVGN